MKKILSLILALAWMSCALGANLAPVGMDFLTGQQKIFNGNQTLNLGTGSILCDGGKFGSDGNGNLTGTTLTSSINSGEISLDSTRLYESAGGTVTVNWTALALTGAWTLNGASLPSAPIVTASSPTTGQTVSAATSKLDETLYITPAGTLLALTFSLPTSANSRVGQIERGFISQIITTLTVSVSGSGTVIGSLPITSAVNSSFAYQCVRVSGNGTWIRLY